MNVPGHPIVNAHAISGGSAHVLCGVVATVRREDRAAGSPAGGHQDAMTVRLAMTQPVEGHSANGHRDLVQHFRQAPLPWLVPSPLRLGHHA